MYFNAARVVIDVHQKSPKHKADPLRERTGRLKTVILKTTQIEFWHMLCSSSSVTGEMHV